MNYQNSTFIFAKIAYNLFIQKKMTAKDLSENAFFSKFTAEIALINFAEINKVWDSHFCLEFLTKAQIVCEFEALTFLPDESKEEYQQALNNLSLISKKIFANCTFANEIEKNLFLEKWRIFISAYVTFNEWCLDINFYHFQKNEQLQLLREAPLISLNQL